MPSLHQILTAQSLVALKQLLTTANIAFAADCRRKAPLVALLLANPAAIPVDTRRAAVPPLLLPGDEGFAPPNQDGPAPDLVAQMREMISSALLDNIGPLVARIAALEDRPGEQIITTTPAPGPSAPAPVVAAVTALLPGITVPLPSNPRVFFDSIDEDIYQAVVNNTFSVRDLWKLDPRRQGEMLGAAPQVSALQSLASALNSTEDAQTALAKGKYKQLGEILRPWLVYAQLRETLTPGILFYLTGYAIELVRIDAQYPGQFSLLLDYHLRVCKKRMNVGSALDPNEWCRTDNALFFEIFVAISFAQPPATTSTAAPSSSATRTQATSASAQWVISSVGLGTKPYPCDKWNAAKPCASTPCPFQHVCKSCKAAGHTAMRCQGKTG